MMNTKSITILAVFIVITFLHRSTNGRSVRPEPCILKEVDRPQDCPFGDTKDQCDRTVCLRGPSEVCGGTGNAKGECGEGLICQNEICEGCYVITYEPQILFLCSDGQMPPSHLRNGLRLLTNKIHNNY